MRSNSLPHADIGSVILTIFLALQVAVFLVYKGSGHLLATNRQWFWPRILVLQGSGNADSRRKLRNCRGGGAGCRSSRDFGCVAIQPPYRRAAPYLPLRADWAFLAWALRGCTRDQAPSALNA